jgi:hypothetical protein
VSEGWVDNYVWVELEQLQEFDERTNHLGPLLMAAQVNLVDISDKDFVIQFWWRQWLQQMSNDWLSRDKLNEEWG